MMRNSAVAEDREFLEGLEREDLIFLIKKIKNYKNISVDELRDLLRQDEKEIQIPSFIFVKELGALESIVKYLKEDLKLNFHKIAVTLNRDDRTVWATYHHSLKKLRSRFMYKKSEITIPVSIIRNRELSVLENIVKYLKEELGMKYHEIAELLNRDDRTIWTTYHRVKEKKV